jgi:hypothetical protein
MKRIYFGLVSLLLISCQSNDKVMSLLKSADKEDIIQGSYKAGKSGEHMFIPYLLANANDPRRSTNIRFKSLSVYSAKMKALSKIFHQSPPIEITQNPDSAVIKFFIELAKKDSIKNK